jgi:hypothetical protein
MDASMNLKIVEDPSQPVDTIILLSPRYKLEPSKDYPMVMDEVLDVEATARASVMITGIGGVK